MPTYQYQCTECGNALEVHQSFTDEALTECPVCGGRLRKVFNAVGVVFKGSGFYRNDSRGSTTTSDTGSSNGSSSSSSTSGDAPASSPSGSKTPSAPAAPSTGSSTGSSSSGSSSGAA